MKRKKILIAILALPGAVFIGAIGSGVWDLILKPTLFRGRDTILNIAVLGMEVLKNDIYEEVSKGFHEKPSLEIYFIVIFLLTISLIFFASIHYFKTMEIKKEHEKLLLKIKSKIEEKKENEKKYLSPADIFKEESKRKPFILLLSILNIINIVLIIVLITNMLLLYYSRNYINSAITHFQQMSSIVKPYLDRQQENQIVSEFAQIKNKQDYVNVIAKLEQLAKKNNLEIPEFEPW